MVDGACYRVGGGGSVAAADDGWEVPFAVVTRFVPDDSSALASFATLAELEATLDDLRPSENVFVGLRIEGRFARLSLRAACKAGAGEGLVAATSHQSEFTAGDVDGTLVGFWTPIYATAVNVPGYHFHFLGADHSVGGHVLDAQAGPLEVGLHVESDLHIVIPQTAEFLQADLSRDAAEALRIAESPRT
jgi:acetolactate decarboxylase